MLTPARIPGALHAAERATGLLPLSAAKSETVGGFTRAALDTLGGVRVGQAVHPRAGLRRLRRAVPQVLGSLAVREAVASR
ncbi:hypothetical protein [Alloactinosynnema sp. L-07]|nr:hypothetical protein [Alloactinosynnema sp. L-07]